MVVSSKSCHRTIISRLPCFRWTEYCRGRKPQVNSTCTEQTRSGKRRTAGVIPLSPPPAEVSQVIFAIQQYSNSRIMCKCSCRRCTKMTPQSFYRLGTEETTSPMVTGESKASCGRKILYIRFCLPRNVGEIL